MKKQTKFILVIISVVILVSFLAILNGVKPSKFDDFAKSLNDRGAKFYGTFWCTHCQSQKALFGNAKKYLPYIECSNPDKSTKQLCLDNKIESFPTWTFEDDMLIVSDIEPVACPLAKEGVVLTDMCISSASKYFKVYIFDGYNFLVRSIDDPIKENNIYRFKNTYQITGEVSFEFLANQIKFELPK